MMHHARFILCLTFSLVALAFFAPQTFAQDYVLVPQAGQDLNIQDLRAKDRTAVTGEVGDALIVNTRVALPANTRLIIPSEISANAFDDNPDPIMLWTFADYGWGIPNAKNHRGQGIVVAVVDTGSATSHTDMYTRVQGHNILADIPSYQAQYPDPNLTPDDQGHGSVVSSIIAAPQNDIGITGIAPNVKIMPVKALDQNAEGTSLSISQGIRWAVDNGADIINVSAGGSNDPGGLMLSAVQYATAHGVPVVCASGNSYATSPSSILKYPAQYDECISVGGVDKFGQIASYSQRGPMLDFVAPGSGIIAINPFIFDRWTNVSGTSFAAPHVTGLLASIWTNNLSNAQSLLQNNVIDLGDVGKDNTFGFGLINPDAVIQAFEAEQAVDPGDNGDPGTDPGDDGTDPGDNGDPGTDPGDDGTDPGTDPGDNGDPGTDPGTDPSDNGNPGTDPGDDGDTGSGSGDPDPGNGGTDPNPGTGSGNTTPNTGTNPAPNTGPQNTNTGSQHPGASNPPHETTGIQTPVPIVNDIKQTSLQPQAKQTVTQLVKTGQVKFLFTTATSGAKLKVVITLSATEARKLGLGKKAIVLGTKTITTNGSQAQIQISLTAKMKQALKKHKTKNLKLTTQSSLTVDNKTKTVSQVVQFRN